MMNGHTLRHRMGMPGLRQAAMLAYQHLKNYLEPYGCTPVEGTIGTWKYDEFPTIFLCVDDFGVKCWSKEDSERLCNSIGANFWHVVDREGTNYCGFTLENNYKLGHVHGSMPNYTHKTLKQLNHEPNKKHNALLINMFQ